jgi:hypothetical protein
MPPLQALRWVQPSAASSGLLEARSTLFRRARVQIYGILIAIIVGALMWSGIIAGGVAMLELFTEGAPC